MLTLYSFILELFVYTLMVIVCHCSQNHYKCGALICAGNRRNNGLPMDRKPKRFTASGKECMYSIQKSYIYYTVSIAGVSEVSRLCLGSVMDLTNNDVVFHGYSYTVHN